MPKSPPMLPAANGAARPAAMASREWLAGSSHRSAAAIRPSSDCRSMKRGCCWKALATAASAGVPRNRPKHGEGLIHPAPEHFNGDGIGLPQGFEQSRSPYPELVMKHLLASCAVIALMAAPALAQSTYQPTEPVDPTAVPEVMVDPETTDDADVQVDATVESESDVSVTMEIGR